MEELILVILVVSTVGCLSILLPKWHSYRDGFNAFNAMVRNDSQFWTRKSDISRVSYLARRWCEKKFPVYITNRATKLIFFYIRMLLSIGLTVMTNYYLQDEGFMVRAGVSMVVAVLSNEVVYAIQRRMTIVPRFKMDDIKRALADFALLQDMAQIIPSMIYKTTDEEEYMRLITDKDYLLSKDAVITVLKKYRTGIKSVEEIPESVIAGDPALKECWDEITSKPIIKRVDVVLTGADEVELKKRSINL